MQTQPQTKEVPNVWDGYLELMPRTANAMGTTRDDLTDKQVRTISARGIGAAGHSDLVEVTPESLRAAAHERKQQLRAEPSTDNAPPIDALITSLVLAGVRQNRRWADSLVSRIVPLDQGGEPIFQGRTFWYQVLGDDRRGVHDTRLTEGADMLLVSDSHSWVSGEMEYHGVGSIISKEERERVFSNVGLMERRAELPLQILSNYWQYLVTQILLDTTASATYGDVTTLGAGAEWDSGTGDYVADIRAMITAVADATSRNPDQLNLALTRDSVDAIMALAANLSRINFNTTGNNLGSRGDVKEALRQFFGLNDVVEVNPYIAALGADSTTPILADMAFIYVPNEAANSPDTDVRQGGDTWFANFALNDGAVAPSFELPLARKTVMPAFAEYKLDIVKATSAAARFNTAE